MPGHPEGYLFDLDGTLYLRGAAVPGAPELIAALRREGVPFRFVTNTTSRPRRELAARLASYGFVAEEAEIFSPMVAAGEIAREQGCRTLAPFVPAASLSDLAGFELAGGSSGRPAVGRPDAVLVGDLGEQWTFALLQEAFTWLMDGALLVALSRDRYWRRGDELALDAGPFVAALEYATSRAALVAGKPSPRFFHGAVASMGLAAATRQVAMVGDDLWGDVRGAQEAGYQGWLVRTGKFREDALRESGIRPDRVLDTVADLLGQSRRERQA